MKFESICFIFLAHFFIFGCNANNENSQSSIFYHDKTYWQSRFKIETYSPNNEIIGSYDTSLAATCTNGIYVGKLDQETNVKMWRGIPFGVINKRFEQSIAPAISNKVFEASIDEADERLRQFANDTTLQEINYYLTSKQSQNNGNTYVYAFDQSYDGYISYLKATYAIDCFYLFRNFDGNHSSGSNSEVDLSIKFQSSVTSFLKNGNPLNWPNYDISIRKCMKISTTQYKIIDNFESERHEYLETMIDSSLHLKYCPSWSDLLKIVSANKEK